MGRTHTLLEKMFDLGAEQGVTLSSHSSCLCPRTFSLVFILFLAATSQHLLSKYSLHSLFTVSLHTHTLWAALPSLVILNLSLISPSDSCLVDSSSKHQIRPSSQTSLSLLPLTLLFSNWEQTTLHTDRNPPVRWFQSELCWSPAAEEWKVFGTVWWDRKCLRYEIHDRTWQSLTCRELFDKCNVF